MHIMFVHLYLFILSKYASTVFSRMKLRHFLAQNDIMMETLNGTEDSNFALAGPVGTILGILSVCLMLTRILHKRRGVGRRPENMHSHQVSVGMQESSAGNNSHGASSDVRLSGIILSADRDNGRVACMKGSINGERAHLLENGHCTMYT